MYQSNPWLFLQVFPWFYPGFPRVGVSSNILSDSHFYSRDMWRYSQLFIKIRIGLECVYMSLHSRVCNFTIFIAFLMHNVEQTDEAKGSTFAYQLQHAGQLSQLGGCFLYLNTSVYLVDLR